ncbi:hypothetical protein PAXRUDRAFT_35224 [Paxillus rubicundulus Ve08.2h10]|uniref:Uncharacterized protein n=1 Tax=Paxillus rubicundulus Ve08.2h10 TaxID=930991 RepID=A0A0D0DWU9_9AGAM|nr:hypothetical protein PAXRUDRAFT_35224 [Paxillus rubicundulus Ve08.2h10]
MSTPAEKSHVVQMLGDVIFLNLEGIIMPSQPVIIQKDIMPNVEGDIEGVKIEAGDGDISTASLYPCEILKKLSERFCVKQHKGAVQSVYARDCQRDAQYRKTS